MTACERCGLAPASGVWRIVLRPAFGQHEQAPLIRALCAACAFSAASWLKTLRRTERVVGTLRVPETRSFTRVERVELVTTLHSKGG